jgi:UDP-N-acetylglucosamine 2-epimerase (non-hydrolysing)
MEKELQFLHVVGARPNFMKAAPVIKALTAIDASQQLVHTGQHYDPSLSDVFFRDLGLPEPDVYLGVGSGSHAGQTANVMLGIERTLLDLQPERLIVYGDINSTLAAALVAAKLRIPVAHVEAGLRSFDETMPEEINRRLTDHLSDLLFVTAPEGLVNLRAEGFSDASVSFVGNPMIDTLLEHLDRFDEDRARAKFELRSQYAVVTVHRPSNVDDAAAAKLIVRMIQDLSDLLAVVLPLHPRGREALRKAGMVETQRLTITDPLGYVEFLSLVRGASLVVTDSGGVQEETTVLGVPCFTIRPNTERPITITQGTNRLIEPEDVAREASNLLGGTFERKGPPPLWDGHAGPRIARRLMDNQAGR